MRVFVTGGRGMLGTAVCRLFSLQGDQIFASDSCRADITDAAATNESIVAFNPDLVVHCAAMANVDGCELDKVSAFKLNATGARNVAIACRAVGARLVYISTDFVFDGTKTDPYTELDQTNPINVYGASKLAGEELVHEVCPECYIVRTSWLFGANGKCFPKTILRLAATKTSFGVVSDQIGSPTYVDDLAERLLEITDGLEFGLYHVSNSGECSWHEFAQSIIEIAGVKGVSINPISAAAWLSPAKRPAYSVMKSLTLERQGKSPLRHWKTALDDFLTDNDL
jgi:dTDP-4-dehydrorhamnose reductase